MNEFNLTPKDTYVVFKLRTGEQLIAVQRSEDVNDIVIEYPMLVKSYAFQDDEDPNSVSENITASPFCKFSEDKVFTFKKTDLIFVKKLHQYAIPFYVNLVEEYEKTVEAVDDNVSTIEELASKVESIIRTINQQTEQEEEVKESKPNRLTNNTYH